MKILVQFPTFGRPQKFIDCLRQYLDLISGKHEVCFNIVMDASDTETLWRISEIEDLITDRGRGSTHVIHTLPNTTKISAMNANIDDQFYEIIVATSDDMIPKEFGWDDIIAREMVEYYPRLDGCISFNDGYAKNGLVTLSIMGMELYKEFGYIYHPDYKSLYCDNEFTQEVTRMGKITYLDQLIIRHEHYGEEGNSNSGDTDVATQKTLHFAGRDGMVFKEREKRKFPKTKITAD